MRKNTALILCITALLFTFLFTPAKAGSLEENDQSTAIILAYGRIGDELNQDNNLQTDRFVEQINLLLSGGYNLASLDTILDAFEKGQSLPEKTVAITFDGAYKSAAQNAFPLLIKNNIPFTVFYASDHADNPAGEYMDWNDLKQIKHYENATLSILPSAYIRLIGLSKLEIQTQLNKAKTKHREAFNEEPQYFSYPYGEYSKSIRSLIKDQNFRAAFSLTSGPAFKDQDTLSLPRFAISDDYSDNDRFNLLLNTLPLPISNLEPSDPVTANASPNIGFTLDEELKNSVQNLRCFSSDNQIPDLVTIGASRIELRLKKPLSAYRTRINCTLPVKSSPDDDVINSWRWLGLMLIYSKLIPESD